jgi:putative transposase
VTTRGRQPILIAAEIRSALRNAIVKVRASAPFTIDAMVLLPDHLHCIWTLPAGDTNYPARWQMIKTIVTQRCCGDLEIAGIAAG